jgi:16S rRNA (cytidine1402-2'-O)-methyltransferase
MLEALATHCSSNTLVCVATDLTLETESVRTASVQQWKKDIAAGKMPDFRKKPTVFLMLA